MQFQKKEELRDHLHSVSLEMVTSCISFKNLE